MREKAYEAEIIIFRITYQPYTDPNFFEATLTRRLELPYHIFSTERSWFNTVMHQDQAQLPHETTRRYMDYHIYYGKSELFTLHGFGYGKIIVILGVTSNYWVYYANYPRHVRLEGRGELPFKYCDCLVKRELPNILQEMKKRHYPGADGK